MAAKRKKSKNKQAERLAMVMSYARALNLHSIEDYHQWCRQQGFSTNLNKTQAQLERESRHFQTAVATSKLQQYKREGNLRHLIDRIYSQTIDYQALNSALLKAIYNGFKKTVNRKLLREVLLQLEDNSRLLSHIDYVKGVISFVAHYHLWLRPFVQWRPITHNANRQFASLARHLFAQYEVPAFMDSVWHKGNGQAKGWFIHIGMGKNIRSAPSLPIRMTKKMAHYFLQAPAGYDVNGAFRWAQVHALDGNKPIADAVVDTRMGHEFRDDDFWLSVLRFFIANPLLDTRHYNPIVDYIWHKKYENRVLFVERGVAQELGPEQPNFSMHGRTAHSLLSQVENWHRQLGRQARGANLQWRKSKLADFRYVQGRANKHNMKIWTIEELLSSQELVAEGRAQQHCVASYARSCYSGSTSIWTMAVQDNGARQKLLTIEVHNPTATIRQVRGVGNRLATSNEMAIIHRWTQKQGLSVAGYI